jgi:hypothetical protein
LAPFSAAASAAQNAAFPAPTTTTSHLPATFLSLPSPPSVTGDCPL